MSLRDEMMFIFGRLNQCDFMGHVPIIAGSAAMVLHGIELGRTPGDIDTFVTTEGWFDLLYGEWELFIPDSSDPKRRHDPPYLIDHGEPSETDNIPVHAFYGWRYRPDNNWDIARMDLEATPICNGSYLVAGLDTVYQQKMQARRPKDLRDMALILEHENR